MSRIIPDLRRVLSAPLNDIQITENNNHEYQYFLSVVSCWKVPTGEGEILRGKGRVLTILRVYLLIKVLLFFLISLDFWFIFCLSKSLNLTNILYLIFQQEPLSVKEFTLQEMQHTLIFTPLEVGLVLAADVCTFPGSWQGSIAKEMKT